MLQPVQEDDPDNSGLDLFSLEILKISRKYGFCKA